MRGIRKCLLICLLLTLGVPISVVAQAPKCSEWKKESRTIITSSISGQISDTGWQDAGTVDGDCKNELTGTNSCSSETIPGLSLGDNDETITTCEDERFDCITDTECCKDGPSITLSIQLPGWEPAKDALKNAAESMPMISEFTPSIAASVSKEDGTKCCLKDVSLPPIDFDQYSGTVTGSLGITLNLPGWNGSYGFGYQGIFYVSFSYALGPNITLTPSLAASVVGLDYDSSEPNCKSCISVGINASVGVAIGFGGNVTATVAIYPGTIWEWGVVAQINIGVNLSSSINGGVAYKWDMCPEPGVSGTIGYGQLVGQANAGLTLFGYVLSYSWSVTLLQGGTLQFP